MSKATYQFNCVNGFDPDTGDCLFVEFQDASDFACREAEFRAGVDSKTCDYLTFDEFILACKNEQWINPCWEFYCYPADGFCQLIYVAYNRDDDIHYFFT